MDDYSKAISALKEYIDMRRAAERYYKQHPEIGELIHDLDAHMRDKLTDSEIREHLGRMELASRSGVSSQ